MHRAGTAERDQRERPRVVPAFECHPANRAGHRGVRHPPHPAGRRDGPLQVRRRREVGQRGGRRPGIECQVLAECGLGTQVATDQCRVRDGRLVATPAVTGWPGVGAGGAGSHTERTAGVDPRHRAAAGPDSLDVDHRNPDRVPADRRLGCSLDDSVPDETHVGRCSAHIEGDDTVGISRCEQ
ncbi:MAG: hypothetical protein J07HX64_03054 [halophilic archaeon J07HX64]|nr:MAG: hypothetical protein J07HX64_03054 [halophilic archaeon J07HX64]